MLIEYTDSEPSNAAAAVIPSRRVNKKSSPKKTEDVPAKDAEDISLNRSKKVGSASSSAQDNAKAYEDGESPGAGAYEQEDGEDRQDPLRRSFFGAEGSSSIANELRRYSSMSSAVPSQLRSILSNLKPNNDPSGQRMALEELSNLLLLSTEDNLAGHFSPDQFITELVKLSRPSETEQDNSETSILACRCIANLMEALPPSTANVVYGGAVPVLCTQLRNIMFIDNAEQALSVSFFLTLLEVQALTATGPGKDFCRISFLYCPRRWFVGVLGLYRFLRHKHSEGSGQHSC